METNPPGNSQLKTRRSDEPGSRTAQPASRYIGSAPRVFCRGITSRDYHFSGLSSSFAQIMLFDVSSFIIRQSF